jgi:hypothetical protein
MFAAVAAMSEMDFGSPLNLLPPPTIMETVGPNRGHGVSGVRSGPPGLGQGTQTRSQGIYTKASAL